MSELIIDSRLKRKIEQVHEWKGAYSVKFKDIEDVFWFDLKEDVQAFLNLHTKERFYDTSLRNGYFDYLTEYQETLRYYIEVNKGNLTILKEMNLGVLGAIQGA